MNILIIGNGAAAISAIEAIRARDAEAAITVVSKEASPAYTPCFLAPYVGGEIAKERLFMRPESFYRDRGVTVLSGVSAVEVRPAARSVLLSSGKEARYDRLLLAAGSNPVMPPLPGIEGSGVFFFRTLMDADKIKSALPKCKEAVVIGAGFIGLEIAEALAKRGLTVTVIEREEKVLPRMLDQEFADVVERHLQDNGIRIKRGRSVKSVDRGGVRKGLKGVVLDNGERIHCDLLIVSVGVKSNMEMLKDNAIKKERGILVDDHMRTSMPGVYAAGDIAEVEIGGVRSVNPIHINAVKGGEIAGANMAGGDKRLPSPVEDMNMVTLFGLRVLSLGAHKGDMIMQGKEYGVLSRIYLDGERRIQGFQQIGGGMRGGVYLSLIRKGTAIRELPQLLSPGFNYGATIKYF